MTEFILWTVYDHPTDIPDSFVARKWLFADDHMVATEDVILAPDAETIREQLRAQGLVCMPRNVDDDPKIVETWL